MIGVGRARWWPTEWQHHGVSGEKDKDKDYIIMSSVRTQRTTIEIKWDIVGEKMIKDVLLNVTIT